MLVADFQPTFIVEDAGFLEFLKVIDQRYQPPSRRTLMRDHLPQLYEETHNCGRYYQYYQGQKTHLSGGKTTAIYFLN